MEEEKKIEIEPSIPKADLGKLQHSIFKEVIDSGLITEQGIRIQGVGILIRKIEALTKMTDSTNLKLWKLENALRGKPEPHH